MEPTHQTELDSRVLKAAVEKGLISQQTADLAQAKAASEKTMATVLLIRQGVLTQHIVDNLAGGPTQAEPQAVAGFKIQGRLGQGGMGTVYRALQVSMNRSVALKVIARQFAADPAFCERFLREARAAGAVNHANVITCYDVGQADGWLYMALELMSGGDAASAAKLAGGRLPEAQALRIIADGARGLAALKRAGLIHRDIKPANIFISEDGVAKLGDLGLARSTSGDDRMTMTGAAMGTPAFMSPEQASGEANLDIRTDLYALGATLFSLLTGDTPFRGQSAFAVVAKVINDPVPDPRSFHAGVTDAAAAVILKAMCKDRDGRYLAPEAMIEDIERALTGRELLHAKLAPRPAVSQTVLTPSRGARQLAPSSTPATIPLTPPQATPAPRSEQIANAQTIAVPPPAAPSRKGRVAAIGVAVAAVVVLAVAAGTRHRKHAHPVEPEPAPVAVASKPAAQPQPAQPADPAQPTRPLPDPVAVAPAPPPPQPVPHDPGAALDQQLALAPSSPQEPRERPKLDELPPEPVPAAPRPQPAPVVAPPAPAPVAETRPIPPAPAPAAKPTPPVKPRPAPVVALRPLAALPPRAAPIPAAQLDSYRAALREKKLTAAVADAGDGGLVVQVDPGMRDLSGLAGLPVSRLECEGCERLESLAALAGLPLRSLSLRGCTDLRSLAGIEPLRLESLDLTNCASLEGDLTALRAMPLTELHVAGCRGLVSLAGIEGARLATLDLTDCRRLSSIAALAGMPLKNLILQRCGRVTDLAALAGSPLTQLDLTGCVGVTTLEPLRGLKLTRLTLEDCKRLANLTGIDSPALTELTITHCAALKDLDGLQGLRLRRLAVVHCDIASLAGLAGNPLSSLELTECGELQGDLSALAGLPLQLVTLRGCSSLASLAGLEKAPLRQVTIASCRRLVDTRAAERPGVALNKD